MFIILSKGRCRLKFLGKDSLEALREHEVKKIFLSLRSRIKEIEGKKKLSKKENQTLKELQTYYCYVFRELEKRRVV